MLLVQILGLDPSTAAVGVGIVEYHLIEEKVVRRARIAATLLPTQKVKGNATTARLGRIRQMREAFLNIPLGEIEMIAYEDIQGQHLDTSGLHQVIGGLLTLSYFDGIEVEAVNRHQACAAIGCGALFRESAKTREAQEAKRTRLKAAVMQWAKENVEYTGTLDDNAADALAVCEAAFRLWQQEQAAKERAKQAKMQGTLFGKKVGR